MTGSTGGAVPSIPLAHLRSIMEPSAAASLRASGDAFHDMGRDFDAQFCWDMAENAEKVGDIYYRHWAVEQADRVIAKQEQNNG